MAFPGSTAGSRQNKPVLPGSTRPCTDPEVTTLRVQFVIIIGSNVIINVNTDDNIMLTKSLIFAANGLYQAEAKAV